MVSLWAVELRRLEAPARPSADLSLPSGGSGVTGGRRCRSAGAGGSDAVSRDQRGCCTFVLHTGSSSEGQVPVRTARRAAFLAWEAPSIGVHRCPSLGHGDSYSLGYSALAQARTNLAAHGSGGDRSPARVAALTVSNVVLGPHVVQGRLLYAGTVLNGIALLRRAHSGYRLRRKR